MRPLLARNQRRLIDRLDALRFGLLSRLDEHDDAEREGTEAFCKDLDECLALARGDDPRAYRREVALQALPGGRR